MKKLYTLLALAALTLSASAARHNVASVAVEDKDAATVVKSTLNVTPALARQAMTDVRAVKAQAPTAAPNFMGITCGYGVPIGENAAGWDTMTLTKVTTDGTKATVQNYPYNGITWENGVYDAEKGTITFSGEAEGSVSIRNDQGEYVPVPVIAYTCSLRTGALVDLVLKYDAEKRVLEYEAADDGENYTEGMFIEEDRELVSEEDDPTLAFFFYTETDEFNSYISYTLQYASGPADITGFVYVEEPVDNVVKVYNPCSMVFTRQIFDNPAEMELNLAEASASIADYMAARGQNGYYQFWNADLSDTVGEFTLMNLTEESTGAPFSVAYAPTLPLGYKSAGQFSGVDMKNYMLEFPYLLDLGGVSNIAIDENAPVEFYNLQGVRVENPAAGLFIRRQGASATKVLVK